MMTYSGFARDASFAFGFVLSTPVRGFMFFLTLFRVLPSFQSALR
jgi:hypothetical protein